MLPVVPSVPVVDPGSAESGLFQPSPQPAPAAPAAPAAAAPGAGSAPPGPECAWYSTEPAVICMNASSSEARCALSSCSTTW